jgi:hypothetical protein
VAIASNIDPLSNLNGARSRLILAGDEAFA